MLLYEARAAAVSVDECRSWARLRTRFDEDCSHRQPAPV